MYVHAHLSCWLFRDANKELLHTVDNNTVSRFLFETADSGAFYDGRTWLHRGNVISNNRFEDIRHTDPQRDNKGGLAAAVYFDDMLSGNSVINNSFHRCDTGVLIGGGRHHLVQGNHFEDIGTQCVWVDARGLNAPGGPAMNEWCKVGGTFEEELRAVHYLSPPWSTRYPELPPIFAANDSVRSCTPANNLVVDNSCAGVGTVFLDTSPSMGHPVKIMEGWRDTFARNVNTSGCRLFDGPGS